MRPFTIQPLECDVFLKDPIYKIQYSLNIITIIIWRLLFKTFHSELCSYFHIFVYIAVFSKEWINPHKKPIKTQHELQGCCSLIKLHITSECKQGTSCYTTAVQAAVLDTFWLVRPAGVKDHFVLIAQTYTLTRLLQPRCTKEHLWTHNASSLEEDGPEQHITTPDVTSQIQTGNLDYGLQRLKTGCMLEVTGYRARNLNISYIFIFYFVGLFFILKKNKKQNSFVMYSW